jgi:hypothetical protein
MSRLPYNQLSSVMPVSSGHTPFRIGGTRDYQPSYFRLRNYRTSVRSTRRARG